MHIPRSKPRSRQGKRQVIAYLMPNQIRAVRARAASNGMTNYEIIAEAVNAVYAHHGRPALFPVSHDRIFRRTRGSAKVKNPEKSPACRGGRQSLAGYFDKVLVEQLAAFSGEIGISIQRMIEEGVYMLTNVVPEEEGWESKLSA